MRLTSLPHTDIEVANHAALKWLSKIGTHILGAAIEFKPHHGKVWRYQVHSSLLKWILWSVLNFTWRALFFLLAFSELRNFSHCNIEKTQRPKLKQKQNCGHKQVVCLLTWNSEPCSPFCNIFSNHNFLFSYYHKHF